MYNYKKRTALLKKWMWEGGQRFMDADISSEGGEILSIDPITAPVQGVFFTCEILHVKIRRLCRCSSPAILHLNQLVSYIVSVNFSEYYPDYFTATILEWKPLLKPNKFKDIIVSSLAFLVQEKRIKLYGFVIMSNHIHSVWQSNRDIILKMFSYHL